MCTEKNWDLPSTAPITAEIYASGRRVPEVGERFVQKDLARSLSLIAEQGRDVFYKGELAKAIVSYLKEQGGLLTAVDFADHHGKWVEPISTKYRNYTIYQVRQILNGSWD